MASFTHMIIDFDGRDRAVVATVGCVLVRAGGALAASAGEAPAVSLPTAAQWELLAGTRRRMLATVGFAEHLGRGAVVGSDDATLSWEPIPPAGPLRDYWKIAWAKT